MRVLARGWTSRQRWFELLRRWEVWCDWHEAKAIVCAHGRRDIANQHPNIPQDVSEARRDISRMLLALTN